MDLSFLNFFKDSYPVIVNIFIIILGLALTISTVDTLENAISSLIVVDGKATFNFNKKTNYLKLSKYLIIFL